MINLDQFARSQGGHIAQCEFAWIIDDHTLTLSQLVAIGKGAFSDLAERYEFIIVSDQWEVDGLFLKVKAECLYWPNGEPARIVLVDDFSSEVPA